MEQLTQKYCLVALLEPAKVGKVFSWKEWVLHVTFAGVHFAEWNNKMVEEFETLVSQINKFEATTLNIDKIGDSDIDVVFVEKSNNILNLHYAVIDFLEKHNAVFNNPEWNREAYIPHSTIQKHAKLSENDTIKIDRIALIDMLPDGDGYMRKIIKVFELKK